MKITFYNSTSEKIRVDKTDYLGQATDLNGTLRDNSSIITPIIEVGFVGFPTYNYCYIEEFQRYYFIDDIVATNNGLWEVYMTVDVLMSFKSQIYDLKPIIVRNQYILNGLGRYQTDELRPRNHYLNQTIRQYPLLPGLRLGDVSYVLTFSANNYSISDYKYIQSAININTDLNITRSVANSSVGAVCIISGDYKDAHYDKEVGLARYIEQCLKDSEVASRTLSITAYPFKIETLDDDKRKKLNEIITLQEGHTLVNGIKYNPYLYEINIDIFRNYDTLIGEKTYRIFIPFVGWQDIDAFELIGYYISIFYEVNVFTNECDVYVVKHKNPYQNSEGYLFANGYVNVIQKHSTQIGASIPISASNLRELQNEHRLANISTIFNAVGLIGDVLSFGSSRALGLTKAGHMTKTKRMRYNSTSGMIESAESAYGTITDSILSQVGVLNKPVLHNANIPGDYNSWKNCSSIVIEESIYETISNSEYEGDFAKNYGIPVMEFRKLSDVHGYTITDDVRMDNFSIATEKEIETIRDFLTSGVIL